MRGELSAIVRNNHPRLSVPGDHVRESRATRIPTIEVSADRGQALARHVIDNVENPEATTIGHLIVNEVDQPAGVDRGFDQDRDADPAMQGNCGEMIKATSRLRAGNEDFT